MDFLDVKLHLNDNGKIETSVFEKTTNAHQYVEFSSSHPRSCKSGIPYSQAKRYRRITSNDEQFSSSIDKLKDYFRLRNYPEHIVNDAVSKVNKMTMDEALQPTSKHKSDIIPFVCTYNPSLPNIGKIINKYWGLLEISQKDSVKNICKSKPIIAYKRPQNIQDILVHTALHSRNNDCSVSICGRSRCSHCSSINESDTFTSTTYSKNFKVNSNLTCSSKGVIYVISCKKCKMQYVGQTQQKCSVRMNSHRFDIRNHPNSYTNVSEHFNSENHSILDFSFMPIENINNNWQRLMKETKWMYKLGTISPDGMNSKILF